METLVHLQKFAVSFFILELVDKSINIEVWYTYQISCEVFLIDSLLMVLMNVLLMASNLLMSNPFSQCLK